MTRIKISSLLITIIIFAGCRATVPETEVYRVFELTLTAESPGANPYTDGPDVSAIFSGVSGEAAGSSCSVRGFWDGGNVWKIRFAPDKPGTWSYKTSSADRGLDGKKGSVNAIPASPGKSSSNMLYHGFLQRNGDYAWKLSDNTPFFPVGETQWSFSEEFSVKEWKEWMDVISAHGYNTFMGCVWLGKYERFDLDPFENKDPSNNILNIRFFREKLDSMVICANEKGIMMGLVIGGFPDNSQWFQKFRTIEQNDRWFKYIIDRYAAYNVRWGLFGELNEASGRFALEDKSWQWVENHYAALVKEYDPYRHPVGSHNTRVDTVAAADPNIDFIEVQEGDRTSPLQYINAMNLRKWQKPVWYEEYWYEMDGKQDVAIRNTHRNFIHALAFPTMGSLMRNHQTPEYLFPPDEAAKMGISLGDYLSRNDTGIIRMSYFADFYKPLTGYLDKFAPSTDLVSRGECGSFGDNLAVFAADGGKVEIDLTARTGEYSVSRLDIRNGDLHDLGKIAGGKRSVVDTGLSTDAALLILKIGN